MNSHIPQSKIFQHIRQKQRAIANSSKETNDNNARKKHIKISALSKFGNVRKDDDLVNIFKLINSRKAEENLMARKYIPASDKLEQMQTQLETAKENKKYQ